MASPLFLITTIKPADGPWFEVQAEDQTTLVPRKLSYLMTEQEIADGNLTEGLEIVPPVLQGIWTSVVKADGSGGCVK